MTPPAVGVLERGFLVNWLRRRIDAWAALVESEDPALRELARNQKYALEVELGALLRTS